MLRRPLTRFVSAISVAGTICAVGAGAALAAPAATWSGPSKPVPGALTNSSPALSNVTFPNPVGQGIIVAWRGRGAAGHIFYKYRTNSKRHWSHNAELAGALTSAAPAVGSYVDPLGRNAVLIVWAGRAPAQVPGAVAQTAPAVSVPRLNGTGSLLLVYRAPFSTHVRFQTLTSGTWSTFATVPRTRTAVAPALLRNILANTTPGSIGNIVLHVYG